MPGRRHPPGVGEAPPRPTPSSDPTPSLDDVIAGLADLDADPLRLQWRNHLGGTAAALAALEDSGLSHAIRRAG
jgi:hypothetical protein